MRVKKTFERELPYGYDQVFYLNAKNFKVGLLFTLLSLIIAAAVIALGLLLYATVDADAKISLTGGSTTVLLVVFYAVLLLYVVLHELVHGLFYKLFTGEKLTFGLSWSCAFCGVPQIYTYRWVTILSAAAPLVLFTVLLVPICVLLLFVHPYLYFLALFLLGLHLGGCVGDLYVVCLLLFKYKDPKVLVRDTGPEQSFYLPDITAH